MALEWFSYQMYDINAVALSADEMQATWICQSARWHFVLLSHLIQIFSFLNVTHTYLHISTYTYWGLYKYAHTRTYKYNSVVHEHPPRQGEGHQQKGTESGPVINARQWTPIKTSKTNWLEHETKNQQKNKKLQQRGNTQKTNSPPPTHTGSKANYKGPATCTSATADKQLEFYI